MPRTLQEIIDQANKLATAPSELQDATELAEVRKAFVQRAEADQGVTAAALRARAAGHSWGSIGAMLGASSEAARQRYGNPVGDEARIVITQIILPDDEDVDDNASNPYRHDHFPGGQCWACEWDLDNVEPIAELELGESSGSKSNT